MAKRSNIQGIRWDIQTTDKDVHVHQKWGECLFVVGANGSGKSALMQKFYTDLNRKEIYTERYPAHRQPWFSIKPDLLPSRDLGTEREQVVSSELRRTSRWQYSSIDDIKHAHIFHKLIEYKSGFDANIRALIDSGEMPAAEELEKIDPLARLNELLKQGNISIAFEINSEKNGLVARHTGNDLEIYIGALSDGERALILFAATAIILPEKSALLIDEPDLHLHQSIIDPFFKALVKSRKDCLFVFSTHNTSLPAVFLDSKTIIVRSCSWIQDSTSRFDIEVLDPKDFIPEYVKQDILGARKDILYVEGSENSLDVPLYRILYPSFSVVPKGSHSVVEDSVKVLQKSYDIHHITTFGLVDRDHREKDEINRLLNKRIGVLSVYSVESIYYSQEAIEAFISFREIAQQRSSQSPSGEKKTAMNPSDIKMQAKIAISKAIEALNQTEIYHRMALHRANIRLRKDMNKARSKINPGEEQKTINIVVSNTYAEEYDNFSTYVKKEDWKSLLTHYPLHKTNAFNAIMTSLDLTKGSYEKILLSLIETDEELAEKLKGYIIMPFG